MRSFILKIWRGFIGFNVSFLLALVLWLGFDVPWYWVIPSAGISFWLVTMIMAKSSIKKVATQNQLKVQEYQEIQKTLQEAKRMLVILQRHRFKAKSYKLFKSINQIYRYAKNIYEIVQKEPKRFYLANDFFYRYLNSATEIVQRYMFLSSQPVRDVEYIESLTRTENMLQDMEQCLERELKKIVSDDLDNLDLELDVLKQSIERTSTTTK
ncbi:5-bromo-4-chloroindolyl phosphate hydrolysis family protein [Bacillus solimangrovi]|uniref:5-bromo-4-chloroindolyl phosphate hydrolysis protein n=1 Tax=Bacillus solimangrovi TaxID=1305675 RepID=A0A1E5LIT8_9BACI|nr:5-bromo-4-chloroindolyl phosphate hydrolysis family protein [Bacillus solimangrovi]OEH93997.1 hypothetical protein BFG57_10140 [Bacillus solimangrovi]